MGITNRTEVAVYPTATAVSEAAAQHFVDLAAAAAARQSVFRVALSGGSTPQQLYELLATPRYREAINWETVEIFWGDERFVPADHPDSNYLMTKTALLDHISLPPGNIHPMPTVPLSPAAAAASYEKTLIDAFNLPTGKLPRFDLILLGLGTDGHTASLFPKTAALTVDNRLVAANFVPQLDSWRLTLTLPVINYAANVAFLIVGATKAPVLKTILAPDAQAAVFPAQMVQPLAGNLRYIIDTAANPL